MIRFSEKNHLYESVVQDNQKWTSCTTLIGGVKEKFDNNIAFRNSNDPDSKWYGIPGEEIQAIWKAEAKRSTDLGTWYHKKCEDAEVNPIKCIEKDGWKYALPQQLKEGVYPEFITYHPGYRVCGQVDRLEIANGVINIEDHKSNKEIKKTSWNGRKMLLHPLQHLQDCNWVHYSLQLSVYAYLVNFHNPDMRVGDLTINHVTFKIEKYDKWGYPVALLVNNEPVVKDVTKHKVEYMKQDVERLLNFHYKENLPISDIVWKQESSL